MRGDSPLLPHGLQVKGQEVEGALTTGRACVPKHCQVWYGACDARWANGVGKARKG